MSGFVTQPVSRQEWERLPAEPPDEAHWQAWVAKGRAHDVRVSARAIAAVKWISLMTLLTVATLWSELTPYALFFRSVVVLGAVVIAAHAFHRKQFHIATVFAACALVYNPVVPAFPFSGDWQRAVVVATALPFAALLFPLRMRKS